ncbi:S41 family peptidase [Telmatocola sphagniphila]|uniref:S41 family peptidase n=1 Tax=Telmatocola sphagniphila TaxID=1123043 RepID=A0A8E6B3Z4_9BACT|nr:S41 family peptidase [Telmatocola sphagniphila]QVL31755.1 S41 family peptidase [Telmatocola sphagniphila]
MTRSNLAWLICVPLLVLSGLAISYSAPPRTKDYELVRTFVDVLARVDQNYVRKLDDAAKQKLVEDMINGGLEKLDRYSTYFGADELAQFNHTTEGNFVGIGITMGYEPNSGRLMVQSPIFGTPAYDAGVLPGDLLLKIEDTSTEKMNFQEAAKLIQGEAGTKVRITILHEGAKAPQELTIPRARIDVPSVTGFQRKKENPGEWEWFADPAQKIAYIHISGFNETTTDELKKAVEKVQAEQARALILDLRDNPGGLLRCAVEVSDMFLMSGKIVSTKDRNGNGPTYEAKASGTLFEPAESHPLVILQSNFSASASEIVAAALQDNGRAIIVGERSYGKGSVQKLIDLGTAPATALKLTVESYWRPSGKNIHRDQNMKDTDEWGVKPNPGFEVELKDTDRLAAIRLRRQREAVGAKMPAENEKSLEDKVLNKALEHLKKTLTGMKPVPFQDVNPGIKL